MDIEVEPVRWDQVADAGKITPRPPAQKTWFTQATPFAGAAQTAGSHGRAGAGAILEQTIAEANVEIVKRGARPGLVPAVRTAGLKPQTPVVSYDPFLLASSPRKAGTIVADLSMRHRRRATTKACWYGSPLARGRRLN
jgi:hypothetical protein